MTTKQLSGLNYSFNQDLNLTALHQIGNENPQILIHCMMELYAQLPSSPVNNAFLNGLGEISAAIAKAEKAV